MKTMPQPARSIRCALLVAATAMCATVYPALAAEPAAGPVEHVVQAEVAVRGTITAIDAGQRLVTLDTGTGSRILPVDSRVADFDRLQVGDVVDVRYHRSVLFDFQPAGSAEPGAFIAEDGRETAHGARIGEQEVTVLAEVAEVDVEGGRFSVVGPAGNVRTLHADRPEHRQALARIRVGDMLRVRFREGLAISFAQVEQH